MVMPGCRLQDSDIFFDTGLSILSVHHSLNLLIFLIQGTARRLLTAE